MWRESVIAWIEANVEIGREPSATSLRRLMRATITEPAEIDAKWICDGFGVHVERFAGQVIEFGERTITYVDLAAGIKQIRVLRERRVGKAKRKTAKKPADAETLQKLVDQYEQVFGEVEHFIDLIARQEEEIGERQRAMYEAKEKFDAARDDLNDSREARDGTKHALFMFLKPGPAEILPLFDRMEEADEEKHGENAAEWRKEPIAALRLSLIATNVLAAADLLFVGQLQDRVQADAEAWWEKIEGLTAPMAAAIADKLNDFITEHTGR